MQLVAVSWACCEVRVGMPNRVVPDITHIHHQKGDFSFKVHAITIIRLVKIAPPLRMAPPRTEYLTIGG